MLRVTIARLAVIGLAAVGCGGGSPRTQSTDGGARDRPADQSTPASDASTTGQTYALTVTAVDTTFVTEDHFIAAVEMQLSGEPFAEAMGRDLAGYSRDFVCQTSLCSPDIYHDPDL